MKARKMKLIQNETFPKTPYFPNQYPQVEVSKEPKVLISSKIAFRGVSRHNKAIIKVYEAQLHGTTQDQSSKT
jgi:hypothetical protein